MDKISPFNLKKFRQETGMSQKQFAEAVDLPTRTYRSYEAGERGLSIEKFRDLKAKLGFHREHEKQSLRARIDYLRISFPALRDLESFCENFLFCHLSEFSAQETRLMNFTHLWQRGNIWIFDFFDKAETKDYQSCLQLSGQGCRELEVLLEYKGITWQAFLQNLFYSYEDCRIKRLDIALDELYKGFGKEEQQVHLPKLIEKLYAKEIALNTFRKWNVTGGGSFIDNDDMEANHGLSLYFGSRQSQLYFNFYEKRYELARQENISLEESLEIFGIWNRYELRFSDQKAQGAIEEYINGVDLGEIARGIINHEMQVYDGINQFGAYKPDQKWQRLFGGVEPLKLSTSPQPYSIERTIRWLTFQVANSLALVSEADRIMQTEYMKMIQNSGEITDRGKATLKLLKASKHYEH
jgi:cro/CI family transcriptional regulator